MDGSTWVPPDRNAPEAPPDPAPPGFIPTPALSQDRAPGGGLQASAPPPGGGDGRPWALILVLGAALVVLVGLAAAVLLGVGSGGDVSKAGDGAGIDELFPASGIPDEPPSERGDLPTTSLPQVVQEPDRSTEAGSSGAPFDELTCAFTGTSKLATPLPLDDTFSSAPNRMTLEPGAAFDCTGGESASAGTIELDATFDELGAFAGVGAGTGRISWRDLPQDQQVPGELAPESSTGVEVQLEFPVIVVWTTILDGPYAGYRGRLVLRDWEPIMSPDGIAGVNFATTSTTFAPL